MRGNHGPNLHGPDVPGVVEEVEIQGHIIDSLILPKVLDEILTHGGSYVLKEIRVGQRQTDLSFAADRGSSAPTTAACGRFLDSITTMERCQPRPTIARSSPRT